MLTGIETAAPALGPEQTFAAETLTLGSSTAITGVLLRRLGHRVAMAALVGDDAHGRFRLDALRREGVDAAGVRVRPTSPRG